jgi:hypothetical protein
VGGWDVDGGWPTRTTDERARGELEEDEEEERLLTRSGMSEYYGSEGFDHPPSDVYSWCTRTVVAFSAMLGLPGA